MHIKVLIVHVYFPWAVYLGINQMVLDIWYTKEIPALQIGSAKHAQKTYTFDQSVGYLSTMIIPPLISLAQKQRIQVELKSLPHLIY